MPNKYLDSVGLAEYTSLVKADLAAKAPLASPALTGTPTAPTPTVGDDSTKIATTEFVNDAIDAEETRADGAYLPFTGGSITGNLSVSGTITGDVTGDVTGNVTGNVTGDLTGNADTATNATNATNDGNGDEIATTYLPLAGGTMTGNITSGTSVFVQRTVDNGFLQFNGATATANGANLILFGKDESRAGAFQLTTRNGSSTKILQGSANGTLIWDEKNVERVNASGTNYIRYDSGFQICWGNASASSSGAAVTFGAAFSANPRVFVTNSLINVHAYYSSLSTTGATLYNNQSSAANCNYLAIGYWK